MNGLLSRCEMTVEKNQNMGKKIHDFLNNIKTINKESININFNHVSPKRTKAKTTNHVF